MLLALLLALCVPAAARRPCPRGLPRIVGGSPVDIADVPWQLALLYTGRRVCGASIISDSWALTAAHCVHSRNLLVASVRGGSSYHDSGGTVRTVDAGHVHDDFDTSTYDYDIAVLQVSGSLIGDDMQPVRLPVDGYDPPTGLCVTATGWGRTWSGGSGSSQLLRADMCVVDRDTCQSFFANPVTERMLCAGHAGCSVCMGDSGGPLVACGVQVGIVSWGANECEEVGAVYVNVGHLRSWIQSATGV